MTETSGGTYAECGTYGGYHRHWRQNTLPCFACREAAHIYHQDKRLAAKRRAVLAEAVGGGSYGGRSS
jgi:hypothetical protein